MSEVLWGHQRAGRQLMAGAGTGVPGQLQPQKSFHPPGFRGEPVPLLPHTQISGSCFVLSPLFLKVIYLVFLPSSFFFFS